MGRGQAGRAATGPRHRRVSDARTQVVYPDFRPTPLVLPVPTVTSQAGCARHIGRVGALAVVLGVGVAMATGLGSGTARAETELGASESAADGARSSNEAPTTADSSAVPSSPSSGQRETPASKHDDAVPAMNYGSSGGAHTSGAVKTATEDDADEPTTVGDDEKPTRSEAAVAEPDEAATSVRDPDTAAGRHRSADVASPVRPTFSPVGSAIAPRVEVPTRPRDVEPGAPSLAPVFTESVSPSVTDRTEIRSIAAEPVPLEAPTTPITVTALTAMLSPFVLPGGPVTPAQTPLLWAMSAMVRRESLTGNASRDALAADGSAAAPTARDDSAVTTVGSPVTVAVLNNDDTADAVTVLTAVALVVAPSGGTAVVNVDRTITYTPAAGFSGSDQFVYRVDDSNGTAATATVRVTVLAVAVDDAFTTPRDTKLVVYDFDGVLANDNAINGRLSVASTGTPAHGTVAVTEDGAVTYTPEKRFVGVDSFTYTVTDGSGLTATATVRVNVTAVPNQAPVAAGEGYDTLENVPVSGNLLTNDEDPDGDPLTVRIVQAGEGTLLLGADGSFTYTPPANNLPYDRGYEFVYEISDGLLTSQASVTFSITHVNVPPELVDDYVTVTAGDTIQIYPLVNDRDPDGDELYMFEVGPATFGRSDQGNVDLINYSAPDDFEGVDTFYYKVFDSAGVVRMATVHVTVVPANRPPVATDDLAQTTPGVPVRIDVLANDVDPDKGDRLTVSSYQQPDRGTVVLNADGSFTYTPPDDVRRGQDFFTYEITDGSGRSAFGSVEVRIRPVNAAPVASGNDYTVRPNAVLHVSADRGVLADDGDPDGDYLSAFMIDGPRHGTIDFLADGSFTYVPDADFTGRDTFSYQAADYERGSEVATVSIEVAATDTAVAAGGSGGSGLGACQSSWLPGSYDVPFAPVFCNVDDAWKARNLRRSL